MAEGAILRGPFGKMLKLNGKIITISVAMPNETTEHQTFSVHRDLIEADSTVISDQLDQGTLASVSLRSNESALSMYLHWLYSGRLCSQDITLRLKEGRDAAEDREYAALANLYRLGVDIGSQKLQKAVIEAFFDRLKESSPPVFPGTWCIGMLQDELPDSDLYKLVVKVYAAEIGSDNLNALQKDVLPAFILDVGLELLALRSEDRPRARTMSAAALLESGAHGSERSKRRRLS